jgi:hypothetical protein
MRYLRFFGLLGVFLGIGLFSASDANAQRVAFGVGFGGPVYYGAAPVCSYGYYDYYPYTCAPYGYYGPDWFEGGVFIGAGPWFGFGRGFGFRDRDRFFGRGFDGRRGFGRGFDGRRGFDHGFRGGDFHGGGFHGSGFRGGSGFHGGGGGGFHGGGGGFHGGGGGFHGGGGHGGGGHR